MRHGSIRRHSSVSTHSRNSKLHVRMSKKSSRNHRCDLPLRVPLGKSTHVEIRNVRVTCFVSFNGEVQCTIDYTRHVLHARIDSNVFVSDTWQTASNVTLRSPQSSFFCVFTARVD